MRYLLTFLFCILVTSNAYGFEKENLDGKALDCTIDKKKSYWVFEHNASYLWKVRDMTPLKISKTNFLGYYTFPQYIQFADYRLNRRDLTVEIGWSDFNIKVVGKCKPTTPAAIEKILNTKIDKLKASMKDNKF